MVSKSLKISLQFLALFVVFAKVDASGAPTLEASIEAVVSADEEVLAWEEALEALDVGLDAGMDLEAPELRLKAEQDELDDALRLGGALRWKLNRGRSNRFRREETLVNKEVYEYQLRRAREELKNSLKRDCLMLSYLKSEEKNLSRLLDLHKERLAKEEALDAHRKVRSFSRLKNRSEALLLSENYDRVQGKIEDLEKALLGEGLTEDVISTIDIQSSWRLDFELEAATEDKELYLTQVLRGHPKFKALRSQRSLLVEEAKDRDKRSGLNLSYVQVQYEQEDDDDEDDRETSFGVSVGVNLPFWNGASKARDAYEKSGSDARFLGDMHLSEREVRSALQEWIRVLEVDSKRGTELTSLIDEMKELRASIRSSGDGYAATELFSMEIEILKLEAMADEYKFDVYRAALDLERVSYETVVTAR
ncbi:hypothetical protein MLD52_17810 [Puniceicoccaceae bacterium K14]|nr:hypothetical protein [Puniceicoccaceae bacterium K14]